MRWDLVEQRWSPWCRARHFLQHLSRNWRLAPFAASIALAGCEIPPPAEIPAAAMCNIPRFILEVEPHAEVPAGGFGTFADELEAVYSRAPAPVPSDETVAIDEPVSLSMLFMSGGSQHGAFGAGFLEGWSADRPGKLPRFLVVTGISTGSIMATHAFIDRPDFIANAYRITHEGQVLAPFVKGNASTLSIASTVFRRGAVGDLKPMRTMLGNAITPDVLELVASEATDAGRKLYVGAVDVDLGKAVIFDMTALAQRFAAAGPDARPAIRECYLDAIVASSVVPVAALPKFIDNRMYIDGGARFGIISDEIGKAVETLSMRMNAAATPAPGGGPVFRPNVFTIINGTLEIETLCGKADAALCSNPDSGAPQGGHAPWRVTDLALRSVSILINQVYRMSHDRIAVSATARGFNSYGVRIGPDAKSFVAQISHPEATSEAKSCGAWMAEDVTAERPLEFHPRYMHCLVAYGGQRGRSSNWACKEAPDLGAGPEQLAAWRRRCGM